jgi:hypothetical protein
VKCLWALPFPFSGVITTLMRRFLSRRFTTGSCSARSCVPAHQSAARARRRRWSSSPPLLPRLWTFLNRPCVVSKTAPLFSLFYMHNAIPTSSPVRPIRPLSSLAALDARSAPLNL